MASLKERLLARIAAEGPLPFETFQAAALYDPDGFFGGDVLRSEKAGDFLTSPEVSPMFGETLATFVDAELARVDGHRVVEVAAGSGSLLRPLLAELGSIERSPQRGDGPRPVEPGGRGAPHAPHELDAWAVEASPAARIVLADVVGPDRVVASLTDVPTPIDGVVLANELLDNLPVALAIREGDGWTERFVGAQDGELALVPVEARPTVAEWAERFGLPCPEGGIVEVQLAAAEWVTEALARLGRGTLVLVDYGDETENLAPRRQDGTLRTYRSHHLGPHPLAEPGETDITVDVNVTALRAALEAAGAEVEVYRQDDFLASLGLRERLSELRHRELALARSSEEGAPMERLQVRSIRNEAETLLHPRGLGDFRVVVARA
ncbi:MAG: SAM-dependent methyltransferase [Acidimicrobiia bacterium]